MLPQHLQPVEIGAPTWNQTTAFALQVRHHITRSSVLKTFLTTGIRTLCLSRVNRVSANTLAGSAVLLTSQLLTSEKLGASHRNRTYVSALRGARHTTRLAMLKTWCRMRDSNSLRPIGSTGLQPAATLQLRRSYTDKVATITTRGGCFDLHCLFPPPGCSSSRRHEG